MDFFKIKETARRRLPLLEAVIFFSIFYLYVWLIIEPRLLYYTFGRTNYYHPFLLGRQFLFESLAAVGGPAAYLTGFLSQCFYFSWVGAVIITLIAWLFWLLIRKLLMKTDTESLGWAGYLIPALMLVSYTSYDHPLLNIISLLGVLAAFVFYIKLDIHRPVAAAVLFLAEFVFLYYIAGGIAVLFGLLTGLYESFIRGRRILAAVFLIWLFIYDILVRQYDLPDMLYAFSIIDTLPLAILLAAAFYRFFFGKKNQADIAHLFSADDKKSMKLSFGSSVRLVLKTSIPFILIIAAFGISYRRAAKVFLKLGYYAEHKEWQKVLDCAGENPDCVDNFLNIHDIDRALYYTGQLGEKMFSFRQTPNALLLSYASSPSDARIWAKLSRKANIFLELGDPGDAERYASEILESTNQCPYTLEKVALTHLVRKRSQTARIYLNVLSRDLIYGGFARQLLRRLDTDPELAGYEPVESLRSVAVQKDNVGEYDPDVFFQDALQRNPKNKMAFEYMMAFYLAMGDLEKVAQNVHWLKEFSYNKMPRHYEEALMIYSVLLNLGQYGEAVDLSGFSPSPQAVQRFERFDRDLSSLMSKTCGDIRAVKAAMAKDHGDSYMYYYRFVLEQEKDE